MYTKWALKIKKNKLLKKIIKKFNYSILCIIFNHLNVTSLIYKDFLFYFFKINLLILTLKKQVKRIKKKLKKKKN